MDIRLYSIRSIHVRLTSHICVFLIKEKVYCFFYCTPYIPLHRHPLTQMNICMYHTVFLIKEKVYCFFFIFALYRGYTSYTLLLSISLLSDTHTMCTHSGASLYRPTITHMNKPHCILEISIDTCD